MNLREKEKKGSSERVAAWTKGKLGANPGFVPVIATTKQGHWCLWQLTWSDWEPAIALIRHLGWVCEVCSGGDHQKGGSTLNAAGTSMDCGLKMNEKRKRRKPGACWDSIFFFSWLLGRRGSLFLLLPLQSHLSPCLCRHSGLCPFKPRAFSP